VTIVALLVWLMPPTFAARASTKIACARCLLRLACDDVVELSALAGITEDQIARAFSVVGYVVIAYGRGGVLAYSAGVAGQQATSKKPDGGSCRIDGSKVVLPAFSRSLTWCRTSGSSGRRWSTTRAR